MSEEMAGRILEAVEELKEEVKDIRVDTNDTKQNQREISTTISMTMMGMDEIRREQREIKRGQLEIKSQIKELDAAALNSN